MTFLLNSSHKIVHIYSDISIKILGYMKGKFLQVSWFEFSSFVWFYWSYPKEKTIHTLQIFVYKRFRIWWICVCLCLYLNTHVYTLVCMCMWSPEGNTECLSQLPLCFILVLTVSPSVVLAAWNSRPGWPGTPRDLFASPSRMLMLRLKVCATILGSNFLFEVQSLLD